MSASNTNECFRELIGLRVVGVMFDTMPSGRSDLSNGTKTLILDDGTGLTISSHGTFWRETRDDMRRGIESRREELSNRHRELAEVLVADGLLKP